MRITDNQILFLNILRESGVTNMFGAGAYLEDHLDLDRKDAGAVLIAWMSGVTDGSISTAVTPDQMRSDVALDLLMELDG